MGMSSTGLAMRSALVVTLTATWAHALLSAKHQTLFVVDPVFTSRRYFVDSSLVAAAASVAAVAAKPAAGFAVGFAATTSPSALPVSFGSLQCLSLGTCCDGDLGHVQRIVTMALEAGFRDVDTASHYGTEAAVGAAVRDAVARGVVASAAAVRVTTKVRRAFQTDLLLERLMDRCCWRKK